MRELLKTLPSIETLLQDYRIGEAAIGVPRRIVVSCLREAVEQVRVAVREASGTFAGEQAIYDAVVERFERGLKEAVGPHYRAVVNATGIVLHTALGRAALPAAAVRQLSEQLRGYSLLQADLATGQRSKRDGRIQWLLRQLTGAEAATVVNNNAAATWLVLNAVAAGREVIVSRGQLVEIGGSFRLPDVMAASGAKMVEVGTTNKTHARDYRQAITENTAAILRVHPSNYTISGFTAEVPLEELAEIAHAHGLVLIDDVGAGALVDLSRFGFDVGPTLADSLRAGADLITSSTDKLIGASQGGIVLGKAAMVEKVRKSPMARIVRAGKLTLAALEATLLQFFDEEQAIREVPTLRMVCRTLAELDAAAGRINAALAPHAAGATVSVIDGASQMGGGSLPGQDLPTRLVAVTPAALAPEDLAARLRQHTPPVFTRIHKGQVLIDPRTLLEGDEERLIAAFAAVLGSS